MTMLKGLVWVLALCAFAGEAVAQDVIVPGRPGNTESPVAVPTGHWQLESELFGYSHNSDDKTNSWDALATSFRYGVAPGWDAEAIVTPVTQISGGGQRDTGFGDLTLRTRKMFAGLHGGSPAVALIAYVTLPTAKDHLGAEDVEGGLIATGDWTLNDKTALTLTGSVAAISNADGYDTGITAGANLSYSFTEKTGGYIELFGASDDGVVASTIDLGVTELVDPHTQLDAGVNLALNHKADDARFSVGWAHLY